MSVGEWFKTRRPVSTLVKVLIDALATILKGKADKIPFNKKPGP